MHDIFKQHTFGAEEKAELDRVGHYALPGLLPEDAQERLIEALTHILSLPRDDEAYLPSRFAAEFNEYLERLIGHPQLLRLVRTVLGEEIRYDHCVALNRPGGNAGSHWHSHEYGNEDSALGFVRVFFYVNGFEADDGGLKVVPGSHLYRDAGLSARSDRELEKGWLDGKMHPGTGKGLQIEELSVPKGTVILMWTHAAHGVTARKEESDTRWCVVYAYRNPGEESRARWISEWFERKEIVGAEGLMGLY